MGKEPVYLLFLTIHAVTDMREKQIYVAVLVLQAFAGMMFQICCGQAGSAAVISCLPGLFCLGVGRLSREEIGYGDGWMILLGGLYVSPGRMMAQLFLASVAACLYAVWLLAAGKLSREGEIPFAPFFLIGYLGGVLYGQK